MARKNDAITIDMVPAVSGVKRQKRNPVTPLPGTARDAMQKAARRYSRFTGHASEPAGYVDIKVPKALVAFGQLDAVQYTTVRGDKVEHYEHRFRAADRPTLAVSPDGKQLFIVGGRYRFTDRGIVDHSDPSRRRKA